MIKKIAFWVKMTFAAILISVATVSKAQTDSLQYQLVIRDAAGQLVISKPVNMKFSLMNGGQSYYEETMKTTTDKYGNISVFVGTGEKVKGSMQEVPWSTMDISLKVEADTDNGNNFKELGIVPIAAAPYAMYAATTESNSIGSGSKDDEVLFEVCDRDGQPVFAVYNSGIVVYVDDSNSDKVKRSGLVVTGRSTKADGSSNDYFTVTAEGTHIYVDDVEGSKVKRSGLIVTGRSTKDQTTDYLAIDAEGTHVYVDDAEGSKVKRSGLIVTGRSTKDQSTDYMTIDAEGTHVYIDDADADKVKRSGFVVTGRSTKDGESAGYFSVDADGTQVIVDNPDANGKVKRSGLVVTGRSTKASQEMFTVDGHLTRVYIDDDSKVKRSGLIITGRNTKGDHYLDIDAQRTIINAWTMNVGSPDDSLMPLKISNDNLFINTNMLLTGDLRQWLKLPSVGDPYKLNVTQDTAITSSDLKTDIMGNYSEIFVLAQLDEKKRCLPLKNMQQILAFDQNGDLTDNLDDASVFVDFDNRLGIHPVKPCENLTITFAIVNYDGHWMFSPQGGSTVIVTDPINYREINITIKAASIEPTITIYAANEYQSRGEATVDGIVAEDGSSTSCNTVIYGTKVELEAKAYEEYVFTGWVVKSSLNADFAIGQYAENPLTIIATKTLYFFPQFQYLEAPLYVKHVREGFEWCDSGDNSNSGYDDCDALYSVDVALKKFAGYDAPNANFTIDVAGYDEDFEIGSVLDGKANTLTITNSIFAYEQTGRKVTINTTVPVGIESDGSKIEATFDVGAGASLGLQRVIVDGVNLNPTANLLMMGAEVVNPIQLADGQTITLYTTGNKATITPAKYNDGLPILDVPEEFGTMAGIVLADAENFTITPTGDEEEGKSWFVDNAGYLRYGENLKVFELTSVDLTASNIASTISRLSDKEDTKYKFVVTDAGVNTNNLTYLYQLLNPSKNGNKTFGPSKLDLSQAAGYSNSYFTYKGDNYNYKVASNNYFFNNLTSIILPSKADIDPSAQTNWFKYVQPTLKEIFIENTTSDKDMWMDGGAIMCRQWDSWNQVYKYSLYCYPSQHEGSSYTISEGITALFDAAFYKNENLEVINNLDKVTSVGGSVFEETKKLEVIDLSGVTEFEVKGYNGGASESPFLFRNSNVKRVILPDWQYTIGEGWFDGCSKLEEVEFKGTTPPHLTNRGSIVTQYSVSNHFSSINSNVIFRVPSGAVRNYIEPKGSGSNNGYSYYEFANTNGNSLFANGTYYITDGTVIAVGVNRIADAISNVSANGQNIIIGGSLTDSQWQSLNTALAGASFPVTLDFSMLSITSFGSWFQNNTKLAGVVLPESVKTIDAGAFSGCTNLNSTNLDAADWFVADNSGNPSLKVELSGQTFAQYLQSCNSKLVNVQSTFYVQQGGTGSGTQSKPFGSIQDAADYVSNNGLSNINYSVVVIGTLEGAQTLDNVSSDIQRITLEGYGTNATLDGEFNNESRGTTLTISTTTPVTIKNLTITGGYNEFGGGLCVNYNPDDNVVVDIESGTNITGNYAVAAGGGVYIDGSSDDYLVKVNLKGGTISNNTSTDDQAADTDAAFGGGGVCVYGSKAQFNMSGNSAISGNAARVSGGGVSVVHGAKFTMKGGVIGGTSDEDGNRVEGVYNYESNGGGIYLRAGTFTMDNDDAVISHNMCVGSGNEDKLKLCGGGAVGVASNGYFIMNSGTISNNTAECNGGGVYLRYASSGFTMNGGTIKNNSCTGKGNGVDVYNGTFVMDNDASVNSSNDVYLDDIKLYIGESLTNRNGATITPSSYDESNTVIAGYNNSNLTESICSRFSVTPEDDGTEWGIALNNANRNIAKLKKAETYGFHSTPTLLPAGTTGSNHSTGRYVLFGDYPASHIASGVTVDETKGKTMGSLTYYPGSDGNWYVKHKVKKNSGTYNDGSTPNNGYDYFKLEPIKWRVLTTNYNGTGKALLMADSATAGFYGDGDGFYTFKGYSDGGTNNRTIGGKEIHPNNYEYSKVRAWLNGLDGSDYDVENWSGLGFLQSAFTAQAQQLIAETQVDNGRAQCFDAEGFATTTADADTCGVTTDKVFLLSRYEVTNPLYGFIDAQEQYNSRMVPPTDYAVASYQSRYQGNGSYTDWYGCVWLLRTPSCYGGGSTMANIGMYGYANGNTSGVTNNYENAIVPAICIDLSSMEIEPIGVQSSAIDDKGTLPGKFIVNAAGKTVQFSQGNLQFVVNDLSNVNTSTDIKYRFACYQYSTFTTWRNKQIPYSDRTEFFGWASGGYPHYTGNSATFYGPQNTTEDVAGTEYDWGKYIITNGGKEAGLWTTLTADEWQYLIDKEGKHGIAQVCGVNGMVLLPDNWTQPDGITFNTGVADEQDATLYAAQNNYNAAQWAAMESAGAVFLPAAGWREYVTSTSFNINLKTEYGTYWSSTPTSDDQTKAMRLDFYSNKLEVTGGGRYNGFSVRLVRVVEP